VPGHINWHSRNGPWTQECCFEVMYLHVGSGFRDCNFLHCYYYLFVVCCLVVCFASVLSSCSGQA